MRKPKLRELREAIKAIFTGPYTPKTFLTPPECLRGLTKFFEDDCIGCGACAEVCPANCIQVVEDRDATPPVRRLTVRTDQCIVCGQCQRYCTTRKGIRVVNEYDTASLTPRSPSFSVQKELLVCEGCGETIGTIDHLKWVARKIGPKTYANPTLMSALHPEMRRSMPRTTGEPAEDRSDLMRPVCTACRRRVLAMEVWG